METLSVSPDMFWKVDMTTIIRTLVVAAVVAVLAMLPFLTFAAGTPKVLGFVTPDSWANAHLKGDLAGEVDFTEINAAAILTVDFNLYDVVYVTDTFLNGGTPVYAANLNSRQGDIETYLAGGGCVIFGVQSFGGDSRTNGDEYNFLPPGLVDGQNIGSQIFGDNVTITDTLHPIFAGVTNTNLSNWVTSYHGLFASGSLTTVAVGPSPGESLIRVGSFGAGKIVGWTLDPDIHNLGTQLLRNAVNWCKREIVAVGGTTSFLTGGSNSSSGNIALLSGGVAAFVAIVATSAWYTRRRWLGSRS